MTGEESVVQLTRLSDGLGVLQQACEAGLLVSKVGDSGGDTKVVRSYPRGRVYPRSSWRQIPEDGFVSHLDSPTSFWVQFACNESELDSLAEQLAAVYGSAGDLTKLALSNPTTGQMCCAQFSNDMQWYRSVVESVSSDGVKVHFVHYGNSETVLRSQVKTLKEELLAIPIQVVHCYLIGIIPPTGTNWTDESISGFSSLVLENAVTVEFVNELAEGVW